MILLLCFTIVGYEGVNGQCCENIDECTEETDNCHSEATCTDTEGGYTCSCNSGFTGNGFKCKGNLAILYTCNGVLSVGVLLYCLHSNFNIEFVNFISVG